MIDVVIVNWNAGPQLAEAVGSVIEHGDGLVERIIVVDNSSTDGSDALALHPLLTIVRAGENLGFARGCNLGARQGGARYILFLNPDAKVMVGTLATVARFMESGAAERVGICGARLVDEYGATARDSARFPVWRTFVGQSLGLSGKIGLFPEQFLTDFDHEYSRMVDHVIGAFFFVRRSVFDLLQGFDEDFFVYYEDLDFSIRAKQAGGNSYFLAEAVAHHKGGGTSARVKARRLFYVLRSRIIYSWKHFPRRGAWIATTLIVTIEPITRLVRAALRRSPAEARDTVRGFWMLWADLGPILRRSRARD